MLATKTILMTQLYPHSFVTANGQFTKHLTA